MYYKVVRSWSELKLCQRSANACVICQLGFISKWESFSWSFVNESIRHIPARIACCRAAGQSSFSRDRSGLDFFAGLTHIHKNLESLIACYWAAGQLIFSRDRSSLEFLCGHDTKKTNIGCSHRSMLERDKFIFSLFLLLNGLEGIDELNLSIPFGPFTNLLSNTHCICAFLHATTML